MSDGSLSQDEIDALLQGTDTIEMESAGGGPAASPLSEPERASFLLMLPGATESQGSNLSILTGKTVTIGDPVVRVRTPTDLAADAPEDLVDVRVDLTDGIRGEHSYLLSRDAATAIASLMMGQQGADLDEASLSAVAEAITQITGTAATAIGNQVGRLIKTAPPDLRLAKRAQVRLPQGEVCVSVEYPLAIEGIAPSRMIEVFSLSLVSEILQLAGGAPAARPAAAPQAGRAARPAAPAAMAQTFGQPFGGPSLDGAMAPPNVQPVQFANLQPTPMSTEQGNIGLLMDVFMEMTVELGRTRRPIKWILGIGEGTIIELDKLAGEAVDILVNHKLIAKGEVVVIDENFGVRVTEIVSQIDRMNELS